MIEQGRVEVDVVDWTDISPPNLSGTDCEVPAIPVEGQVVSWLQRTDGGGIVVGDIFRPGDYSLTRFSDEGRNPNEMIGTRVEGDSVGSIHVTGPGNLSHTVPQEPGVYLLIETEP